MAVSKKKKMLIERVVNVFETGVPEGKYDALVVMADGVNDSRQITFGRSQTTEQGNLKKLLKTYIDSGGQFADRFEPFLGQVGITPLADNDSFKRLLRRAAREDPLMTDAQDAFFDKAYWVPAERWFEKNGFALPLSMLVVYDSYIHSGRIPSFLRKRFIEVPPEKGGNEKTWVSSYVEARHQWLKHHRRELLQKTIYRTQTFLSEIDRNNWSLRQLPISANGVDVR
jgi:chitosanase